MDRVEFSGMFDVMDLLPGKYVLQAIVSQNGQDLPENPAANIENQLRPGVTNYKIRFSISLGNYQKYFRNGPLDLDINLQKMWQVGPRGKKILSFSRWAPFLRATDWDGEDPGFKDRVQDLGLRVRVGNFYLLPF